MNSRILVAGLLIAGGVGAVWIYSKRSTDAPRGPLPEAGKAPADPKASAPAPAKVETPTDPTVAEAARTTAAGEPPAPEEATLEAVEPMLELAAIVQANSMQTDDTSGSAVDELLNGRHAGKTKAQLQRSLRSVDAVLAQQANPDSLPKEQVLPPEAIQSLDIERNWLKEHIGG